MELLDVNKTMRPPDINARVGPHLNIEVTSQDTWPITFKDNPLREAKTEAI